MKELFKNWLKYTPEENTEIWNNSLITFDTSVLLGLYRISPNLSNLFFELTKKIEDRVFLTYHVGLEFHKNRYNAASDNIKVLTDLNKQIIEFEANIKKHKIYNYLTDPTKRNINIDLDFKKQKTKKRKDYYLELEKNDAIYSELDILFKGKILSKFDQTKINKIKSVGKERYKNKIPPGYTDANKENGNEFGDLIIWYEILEKAKKEKKDIILVTNEKKEDWIWSSKDKKTIGARPELKEEFYNQNKNRFKISNLENYILSVGKITGTDIKPSSVKKEFKLEALFEQNTLKIITPDKNFTYVSHNIQQLLEERKDIKQIIDNLKSKDNLDDNQTKLLKDLTLRLIILDENINKNYSQNNEK